MFATGVGRAGLPPSAVEFIDLLGWDDQVLDGRHRVAIASALDEEAARELVVALNVARRHLTLPQRTLIVQELFLPQAEEAAKQRREEGNRLGAEVKHGHSAPYSNEHRATSLQDAVQASGGLTTVASLNRFDVVRDAPETKAIFRFTLRQLARSVRWGRTPSRPRGRPSGLASDRGYDLDRLGMIGTWIPR